MLIESRQALPMRVAQLFNDDEQHLATLSGVLDSGFAMTKRRLVGWRGDGVSSSLPLAAIGRVLLDEEGHDSRVHLVVTPHSGAHAPLILMIRASAIGEAMAFVECLIEATGARPIRKRLGPVFVAAFAS